MFSPKSLIVSVLTFRSLIHFEFIFEYGVRECSHFTLLKTLICLSLSFNRTIKLDLHWRELPRVTQWKFSGSN